MLSPTTISSFSNNNSSHDDTRRHNDNRRHEDNRGYDDNPRYDDYRRHDDCFNVNTSRHNRIYFGAAHNDHRCHDVGDDDDSGHGHDKRDD